MGTETIASACFHSAFSVPLVILNNPLMGTETHHHEDCYISRDIHIKLNNPLMGTETLANVLIGTYFGCTLAKLNNPLMGTETHQTKENHLFLLVCSS